MQISYDIQKKNFIWNAIAGIINASQAIILSMVIMRTSGLYDAGILTIAFATGNLMMMVGKYGVHNYQVSDHCIQWEFPIYFSLRIITSISMLIASLGYVYYMVQYKEYSLYKACIVLSICGLYLIESIEDVFASYYQKIGKLYLGAMIFSFRWIMVLLIISFALLLQYNLLAALVVGNIVNIAIYVLCIFVVNRRCNLVISYCINANVWLLAKQCTPLFLVSFVSFYLVNAPKYAIDQFLAEEIQACYGFVAMPVFVVGLVSSFLYQPKLIQITIDYHSRLYNQVKSHLLCQLGYILFIMLCGIVGAYFWGVPVLSILYQTDLSQYKIELMILLVSSGTLAVTSVVSAFLTIMREQRCILLAHLFTAFVMKLLVDPAVQLYGTMGAAATYLGVILLLSMVLLVWLLIKLQRATLICKAVVKA